jgi:transcriptional regulator with XRE-family HTH domain
MDNNGRKPTGIRKNRDAMKRSMVFGDALRKLLESRGISQRWLADESGTTEATISRYIDGLTLPTAVLVTSIAKALHVSTDYLCGLVDSPTQREPLGAEVRLLVESYDRADAHDKKSIWTILERYMSENEKDGWKDFRLTGTDRTKQ